MCGVGWAPSREGPRRWHLSEDPRGRWENPGVRTWRRGRRAWRAGSEVGMGLRRHKEDVWG